MTSQWLLILAGLMSFVALAIWLLSIGMWFLVAGMTAAIAHAGYTGWRDGLPLLPRRGSEH
jgi:O-antigen/teichoic acid export membrane protein